MKVLFTFMDTTYACKELSEALSNAFDSIYAVAREYRNRDDDRTLVIVLKCPCCHPDPLFENETDEIVLVTPFWGISTSDDNIHSVKKYPPRS